MKKSWTNRTLAGEVADRDIGPTNQFERLPHLVRRLEDPSKSGARNLDCSHGLVT
jgi:hypothetical protein